MLHKSPAILVAIMALAGGATVQAQTMPSTQPATAPSNPGIEPLRLTLHFKNAPLLDVVKSIQWQTGMSLFASHQMMIQFTDHKTMSIEVDNAAFWDVMRELGENSGLHAMRVQDNSGHLYNLMPFLVLRVPASTDWTDLFLVTPTFASLSRTISYIGGRASDSAFRLSLQVLADPAIDLAHLSYEVIVQDAVDENGKSLLQPGAPTAHKLGNQNARAQQFRVMDNNNGGQILLVDSAKNGTKIASLHGVIHVNGSSPLHPLLIADPAANSHASSAGTQIDVIDVNHKDANCIIRFQVKQSPTALRWNPATSPATTYSMIDANGDLLQGKTVSVDKEAAQTTYTLALNPAPGNGGQTINNNVVIANGQANFIGPNAQVQVPDEPAPPASATPEVHSVLVINLPAAPIDYSVPFELKDLPLP